MSGDESPKKGNNDGDVPYPDEEMADNMVLTLQDIEEEADRERYRQITFRGLSEDNVCTYAKGYMKRQGLFSCNTCRDDGCPPAVICFPCSESCHIDHDLHELWPKRNYRCDCGNERFNTKCTLMPEKDTINVRNDYENHNLRGLYCKCNTVYDENTQTMIECVICEDWFHEEHTGLSTTILNALGIDGDMICSECTSKFAIILRPFYSLLKHQVIDEVEEPNSTTLSPGEKDLTAAVEITDTTAPEAVVNAGDSGHSGQDLKLDDEEETMRLLETANCRDPCTRALMCTLNASDFDKIIEAGNVATAWRENWREQICRCARCKEMYAEEGVAFLIDEEDTYDWYLKNSRAPTDHFSEIVSGFDRTTQVDVLSSIDRFRERLTDFLNEIRDAGRVVTVEDVRAFFRQMETEEADKHRLPDRCHDMGD